MHPNSDPMHLDNVLLHPNNVLLQLSNDLMHPGDILLRPSHVLLHANNDLMNPGNVLVHPGIQDSVSQSLCVSKPQSLRNDLGGKCEAFTISTKDSQ